MCLYDETKIRDISGLKSTLKSVRLLFFGGTPGPTTPPPPPPHRSMQCAWVPIPVPHHLNSPICLRGKYIPPNISRRYWLPLAKKNKTKKKQQQQQQQQQKPFPGLSREYSPKLPTFHRIWVHACGPIIFFFLMCIRVGGGGNPVELAVRSTCIEENVH